MNLCAAQFLAAELVDAMRPFCERIEIAGSIRREKPEGIKDVEIVAIPKWERRLKPDAPQSLFDTEPSVRVNLLHEWALHQNPEQEMAPGVRWIKTGTSEIVDWLPKPDGKYWRGLLPTGIKLDLFITTPEQWGTTFLIRTGSADFSHEIVTFARWKAGHTFAGGELVHTKTGRVVPTPEETDVFAALGLDFVPPAERTGADAVKVRRLK